MSELLLSVVIPSYNNAAGLVRLVNSLEQSTLSAERYELLVVDDGSTDKTAQVIADLGGDQNIRLLRHAKNRGRSAARNTGLNAAQAPIVLFLDSDMEATPDLFEFHLSGYGEGVVGVMGDFFLPPFVKKNRWFDYLDGPSRGMRGLAAGANVSMETPYHKVMTANLSVVRKAAQACGGFDEDMSAYGGEDMEFAYRLLNVGQGAIHFEPRAITYHQHRPLKPTLQLLHEYGHDVLPYLEEKHPELRQHLVSRWVSVVSEDVDFGMRFKQVAVFLFLRKPFLFVARLARLAGPRFIAIHAFRYIMLYHTISGYRAASSVE